MYAIAKFRKSYQVFSLNINLVILSAYEIFIKHCHKNDRFVHVSFVLQKHHFESKSEKLLIGKIHQSVSSRESGLRQQLSTPEFGTLYHFTKVSSGLQSVHMIVQHLWNAENVKNI